MTWMAIRLDPSSTKAGPSRAKRWKPPGKIRLLGGGGSAAGEVCKGEGGKGGNRGPANDKINTRSTRVHSFLHTAPHLQRGMANMASMACIEDPSRPLDVRLHKSCRAL